MKFSGLFEVLRMGRGVLSSIIDNDRKQKAEKNEKQTNAHTLSFLVGKARVQF